jgi:aryl-phospho-beta-D-glucosidase BglC (GH1 family)
MITRAIRAFKKGEFLNEFIPVPVALKETMAGSHGDDDKQAALEAATEYNRANYGYGNWYDFCIGEWGTKWDIGGRDEYALRLDKKSVRFSFQSAWAPPTDAYYKLIDLGFTIDAKYYEPGVGFAGWFYDGNDESYDLSNMDITEIENELPEEINAEFGIVENMREWQDEEE